jgi:hypothetical protein
MIEPTRTGAAFCSVTRGWVIAGLQAYRTTTFIRFDHDDQPLEFFTRTAA